MIRFTQDKRPHYGYVDVHVNPADVMSIADITGERSSENRSRITLRNGDAYDVTEYANAAAEKVNSVLEKTESDPANRPYDAQVMSQHNPFK